jgi:hypothetical protein
LKNYEEGTLIRTMDSERFMRKPLRGKDSGHQGKNSFFSAAARINSPTAPETLPRKSESDDSKPN